MLRVSINQYDPLPNGTTKAKLLARFVVTEDGIAEQEGERVDMVVTIPVIDPDNGEQVKLTSDPLRWAELLPTAFRSGSIGAEVDDVADELVAQSAHAGTPPVSPLAVQPWR